MSREDSSDEKKKKDKKRLKVIERRFNLSQRWRDREWLQRLVDQNKLNAGYLQTIDIIKEAADSVFSDNWDLQFELGMTYKDILVPYSYDYVQYSHKRHLAYMEAFRRSYDESEEETLEYLRSRGNSYREYLDYVYATESEPYFISVVDRIYIHRVYMVTRFSEVTVTNSEEASITIKNLFCRLGFKPDGNIDGKLQGTKTTYSVEEFVSSYVHSHLQGVTMTDEEARLEYGGFCQGHGEIIELTNYYNSEHLVGHLMGVFYMIETIAGWESIEGGPHKRIKNIIGKGNIPAISLEDKKNYLYSFVRRISIYTYSESQYPKINWGFKNNRYVILRDETLEDALIGDWVPKGWHAFKAEDGSYFRPANLDPEDVVSKKYIPYKGEKYSLVVEGKIVFNGERKKYINPNIKEYVIKQLESAANKISIKQSAIARLG